MKDTPLDARALSEVIGLIYAAASDASAWPELLERMGAFMLASLERAEEGDLSGAATPAVSQLLADCLVPHLRRAQDLHVELNDLTRQRDGLEAVLGRVPMGMAIVQEDGTVVSMNQAMLSIADGGDLLAVATGRLHDRGQNRLLPAIGAALRDGRTEVPLTLREARPGQAAVSVWVTPLLRAASAAQPLALVLVASSQSRALSVDALGRMFGLTPAEARLTQMLVLGQSLDEASQVLLVSLNTVKTHLKRIFSKMGVRRQSELVQAVYASPLWLLDDAAGSLPDGKALGRLIALRRSGPREEGVLQLPDGRRLAYSDQGDPAGLPVVFMHGLAGSRYLRHPDDSLLMRHRIRLIIPERPGCGDSDPQPARRIADWPEDLRALLDHLRVNRCLVMGYSAGTPYALAAAAALTARVERLHLVAPISPIERLADLKSYPAATRLNILMARHAPGLLRPLMGVAVKDMRQNVFRYVESSMSLSSESDRAVYASPLLRSAHALGVLAGIQRGADELAQDVLLTCGDWGVDFADLRLPVHIWHGEADRLVSPDGARQLAARLPQAQLTMVSGAGHFILYSHWDAILASVAPPDAAPVPGSAPGSTDPWPLGAMA